MPEPCSDPFYSWVRASGLVSEVDEAFAALSAGDPYPLAALEFRAGKPGALAGLVAEEGVKGGSESARLVAAVLNGDFKRTKTDRHRMERKHQVLTLVSIYVSLLEAFQRDPEGFETTGPEIAGERFTTKTEIYKIVGRLAHCDEATVLQIVDRNRRRLRRLSSTTITAGAIV